MNSVTEMDREREAARAEGFFAGLFSRLSVLPEDPWLVEPYLEGYQRGGEVRQDFQESAEAAPGRTISSPRVPYRSREERLGSDDPGQN